MPSSVFTRFNQGRAFTPFPSKPPGLVRGFQMPARKILIPRAASARAVSITCEKLAYIQHRNEFHEKAFENQNKKLQKQSQGLHIFTTEFFNVQHTKN
jgi:hypothetical protein